MNYTFRKFRPGSDTMKSFDCGNSDLNGFLLETGADSPNATLSEQELLASTYIVEDNSTHIILAYFSLLHDKLERRIIDKAIWNKLSRSIPNAKRRSAYPALKIGKLAVSKNAKSQGIGTQILQFIEGLYVNERRAGCRFITVDALLDAEPFYDKCHFKRIVNPTNNSETVLMAFDLMGIK